ncbi:MULTISPECIES: ABC transporter ATP-binding protein [unclassified Saccharopolyspora]|uniref:ABC transporter ATP-binding protein n=1 Tax=unclassified Saccharopolyspora TaxID=2646250 RepID=UPI001CD62857|nr:MULTISPECIES: ABC transporter ATP-binding protein [unclassified Saccharopolyspora]MCA1192024.1 ABC transporter ATP-binding protein/permease [Saccharopolyspora sp. 6V]MCA1281432.1 ABC transporter ATP-binding protein/permease [Saccharopolyspora sp. 7B]
MTAAPGIREIFARFRPHLRPERAGLLVAGVLLVVAALADTAAIWMFMLITDDALAAGSLDAFWAPGAAWLGIAVAGALASFGGAYLSARAAERFLVRLRAHVFAHVQRLSPDFFARRRTGDLVARMSGDVESVERLVASGVVETGTALFGVVLYAGAALYLRWDLALLSFALAPAFWLVARKFSAGIRDASRAERAANGEIASTVAEGLSHVELVQSANQQQRQDAKLHAASMRWFRAKLVEARLSSTYAPLVTVVETVCILLVIGVGVWEISADRITIGGLMAFAAYIGYLYPPLQDLGRITMAVTAARAGAERLVELLDARPAVVDAPDGTAQLPPGGRPGRAVEFDRVAFRYPRAAEHALRDFRLAIRPGEFVLVTGPSGVGKSTLAKLLLRFYDPAAGRVLLDGVDLTRLPLHVVRDQIAFVPQEADVLHGTVAENIAFGRPDATPAEIVAAAREADADEFVRALPEGYETVLGERGALLSGGQRRRIAIARAVLRRTPVLVLDEPTNGLDAESKANVVAPLRKLSRTRTTILISHDPELAELADRVVVLRGGRVAEPARPRSRVLSGELPVPAADDRPTVRLHRPWPAGLTDPLRARGGRA